MILLLDIGNTSVTYGLYGGGRLHSFDQCHESTIPKLVENCSKSGDESTITDIVISSVVPQKTQYLKNRLGKKKGLKLWVIGKNIRLKIDHKYRNYKQLGIDRIVNIYGALHIYTPPFLIFDFGTAITADYVSAKGVFEGGMIIPGPETAFQALIHKAALIPDSLQFPKRYASFLGKTTYECLQSGILEGFASLMDGLVLKYRSRYGKKLRAIATGGLAKIFAPYCHNVDIFDPQHTIKSLLIFYKESCRKP